MLCCASKQIIYEGKKYRMHEANAAIVAAMPYKLIARDRLVLKDIMLLQLG